MHLHNTLSKYWTSASHSLQRTVIQDRNIAQIRSTRSDRCSRQAIYQHRIISPGWGIQDRTTFAGKSSRTCRHPDRTTAPGIRTWPRFQIRNPDRATATGSSSRLGSLLKIGHPGKDHYSIVGYPGQYHFARLCIQDRRPLFQVGRRGQDHCAK